MPPVAMAEVLFVLTSCPSLGTIFHPTGETSTSGLTDASHEVDPLDDMNIDIGPLRVTASFLVSLSVSASRFAMKVCGNGFAIGSVRPSGMSTWRAESEITVSNSTGPD